MKTETDYKCDEFGNLDTDFYVEQAYELRRAYFAKAVRKAIASLKEAIASRRDKSSTASAQAAH